MKLFKKKRKLGTRWGVDFTIGGKRRRIIAGDTRKAAQELFETIVKNRELIKIGLEGELVPQPKIPGTIGDAIDEYLAIKLPQVRNKDLLKVVLGERSTFKKRYGSKKVGEIGPADLEAYRDYLFDRYAKGTIQRNVGVVSAFFNYGTKKRPRWFTENPARGILSNTRKIPKKPGYEKQSLDLVDVRRIVEFFRENDPERSDFLLWKFLSLQRNEEMQRVKFRDFDESTWKLPCRYTKTGEPRYLLIDGDLREIYFRQRERRKGETYMWRKELFSKRAEAFKKACRELSIPLKKGNGTYVLKSAGVHYYLSVLAVPIEEVSAFSGVSINVLNNHYRRATEKKARSTLRHASNQFWYKPDTPEISDTPQTLTHQESLA